MKNIIRTSANISFTTYKTIFVFLCALCVLCGESTAQNFKTLHDGVEYAEVTRNLGEDPVKINLLRLDLKKVRLDVHHALDKAIGLETTSSIATRKKAVAAINAGFFRLDKSPFAGEASDYLVIDGNLLSEGNKLRTGLMVINGKKSSEVSISRVNVNAWVGSQESRFMIKLSGVNRLPEENEIVLLGSVFTKIASDVHAPLTITLNKCARGKKSWASFLYCGDIAINEQNAASSPVVENEYTIAFGSGNFKDKGLLLNEVKIFQASSVKKKAIYIKVEESFNKSLNFTSEVDIVAGVPQLIKNGKIDITWEQEKSSKAFVETRHPRTAVAKMNDGKFLMITVDGRQPGVSVGMNLNELAEYLLELGAVDAMNLDGGGSTTMFLDGKVVNKPSDKEGERKVGDAIVVTLRKK